MSETILWDDESDNFTRRALKKFGPKGLYNNNTKKNQADVIERWLSTERATIASVVDIGCSYGGLIRLLSNIYPDAFMVGVDPGKESIRMAEQNVKKEGVKFVRGHSHRLDFSSNQFDLVILSMVLQWVPRKYLLQTLSEVDRVLVKGGYVFLIEFLPNVPVMSKSKHNSEIFIYKDDYTNLFTSFPWYSEVKRKILMDDLGEHHRQYYSLIKKHEINEMYQLIDGI